ncbi:hypothetical protein ACLMJK_002989 [Lecanora helva]
MTLTKPTVVFIPGAWLGQQTYNDFISFLEESSFPTKYISYPSLNPSNNAITDAAADTESILENAFLPLIEAEGKDVVVIMHSYGGVPGSAAAKGLGKHTRSREGKRGGVIGLIHISGFVLPQGMSVADGQGGDLPEWVIQNEPSTGLTMPHDPMNTLSADIDPAAAKASASNLLPHALLAFKSPAPAPAWTEPGWEGRLAYLVCTEDRAIPKAGQEAMVQGTGMTWLMKEMNGSHNYPFLKEPGKTCSIVEGLAEEFLKIEIH